MTKVAEQERDKILEFILTTRKALDTSNAYHTRAIIELDLLVARIRNGDHRLTAEKYQEVIQSREGV